MNLYKQPGISFKNLRQEGVNSVKKKKVIQKNQLLKQTNSDFEEEEKIRPRNRQFSCKREDNTLLEEENSHLNCLSSSGHSYQDITLLTTFLSNSETPCTCVNLKMNDMCELKNLDTKKIFVAYGAIENLPLEEKLPYMLPSGSSTDTPRNAFRVLLTFANIP